MKLSLNWLKDFVSIPSSVKTEEVGLKLTMHTVEVEEIEEQSEIFNKIVVGKVLKVEKHPNADKLRLSKVNIGKEKLDIVCGASNLEVGQLVPVATIGTVLPNGLEIKQTEIRGEESNGMICAEDELGLGTDHAGIMILDKSAKVGMDFAKYLKLNDVIINVDNKSISNRPDLWGHYGIARELSVVLDVKLKPYVEILNSKRKYNEKEKLNIKIEDKVLCPRYVAVKLNDIRVKESPEWIKKRLSAVGINPINNIVDVTNYVMLELGQPMHAFDSSLVKKIQVRKANKGETLITLDEKQRKLDPNMLVIADGKKVIAIAGVMGGMESGINDKTESIVLESANFEPISIRKTSTKLGLRTDSSMRFEKSLDANLCELALKRAVDLILEQCPKATIATQIFDANNYKNEVEDIEVDLAWLNTRIGEDIPKKQIVDSLTKLGFGVEDKKEKLLINVPSWRATKDVSIKEDILEEVTRIYGYDNLVPVMPKVSMETPMINEDRLFERKLKQILSKSNALSEVSNHSFVGEINLKKMNIDASEYVTISNPFTDQHSLLRQRLIPGLLNNVKFNQFRYDDVAIFEIGSIFINTPGELVSGNDDENIPFQEKHLGIAIASDDSDVLDRAKGVVSNLLDEILNNNAEIRFVISGLSLPWANDVASIDVNGKSIGTVSLLKKEISRNLGIRKKTALVEINFKELLNQLILYGDKKYVSIPKYPVATRDLSFVVNEKILYNDIRNGIIGFNDLITKVELFDVYSGDELDNGKKSLAFHIDYQSPDRTLESEEVDILQKGLVKDLEEKFQANVRDF